MIYIFDNITNREKSIFSNVLKNVSEAPVIYFNYYTPFKDIIDHKLNTDVTSTTHGFSSLKGDYFMNNTDLNEVSFIHSTFARNLHFSPFFSSSTSFDRFFFS